jgi:hypothetical protein
VTYSGVKPIIRTNTAMLITDIALSNANFIMFQKIANILSIVSFLMVASMSAGAFITYRFVTSEQFKSQVMNQILTEVSGSMGKVLDKQLPKTTGVSIPFNGN